MWSAKYFSRLDFRVAPILLALMVISLLVISSTSYVSAPDSPEDLFFTPLVKSQLQWFAVGSCIYLFCAGFDYNKLREWAWFFYVIMILSLVGLFFTPAIHNVHRWYRIPGINFNVQPVELAKIIVIITLSWFLERRQARAHEMGTAFWALLLVGVPAILILKQPDLDAAILLYPIALVIFYFGGVHPLVLRGMSILAFIALAIVLLFLLGVFSHAEMQPYATKVLKNYQYERLKPETDHQKAAVTAIAIGGFTGVGWRRSEVTGRGWVPFPYTDSVFAAYGEEFGFVGMVVLIALYYALLYFSFQVAAVAKDHFGRMLAAGLTVYLAVHVLVNMSMMCGLLPITGIPLLFVTYGGSSVVSAMAALGILQSIYTRRFMF